MRPPNLNFEFKYLKKDCCNILLEYYSPGRFQRVGVTLHGYIERGYGSPVASPTKFHRMSLNMNENQLEKVVDLIYREMVEIYNER